MVLRIIRGALLGIVLGVLLGVGLSGSLYMFNYMRAGGDWEKEKIINDTDRNNYVAIDKIDGAEYQSVSALNVDAVAKRNYNVNELMVALKQHGITDLAKTIAVDNWNESYNTTTISNGIHKKGVNISAGDNEEDNDVLGDNLIRFHVRANSNSDVDIALKYKVRDAVLNAMDEQLNRCTSKEEAKNYLTDNLKLIQRVAESTLSGEGYNYSVNVYLTNDYFPIRQYGEMVLPAGYYEALRIDIGLANGENFWCLLYPAMCVPVEAGGVVTKSGQEELKESLTPEQYDKLFVKKEVPRDNIEIRFKLFELLFGE